MAKATLTKGQQKTKKQYTITCGEAELNLISTALWMLQTFHSVAEDAEKLYLSRLPRVSYPFYSGVHGGGRCAPSVCNKRPGEGANPNNLQVTSEDVPDGEPEPGKVVLEMSEPQAAMLRQLTGRMYGARSGDVYDELTEAGVRGTPLSNLPSLSQIEE